MPRTHPLLCLLLFAPLTACANTQMGRSGFLTDYEALQPAPERLADSVPDDMLLYVHPELGDRDYDSVVIEPVVYVPVDGDPRPVDEDDAKHLGEAFESRLADVLGESFDVVDAPGPKSLRIRAAVTDANPSNVFLNVLGGVLLVPPDMGGASCELEVLDAGSNERLLAMTAKRDGTVFLLWECFFQWGHARHAMKKWAEEVHGILAPEPPGGSS